MPKMKKAKSPRSHELSPKAAKVVDRIKEKTRIPKRYLIEEAILNYLPKKYEGQGANV